MRFSDLIRAAEDGADDVGENIVREAERAGGAVGKAAREVWTAAKRNPAAAGLVLGPMGLIPSVADRFGGGGGRGSGGDGNKGLTGGRVNPMPRLPPPGYGRDGYCACSVDPKTGEAVGVGESFTYSARLQLTGAQAINTDLGDFFTTAASTDLTTNNQFPFDFDVDEASLTVGVTYSTAVAATGTELASLNSLKLIERKYNSQEQYQLTIDELAPLYYYNGTLGTPTATAPAAVAAIYQLQPEAIYAPWGRRYKSAQQWQLVLRTPRAFTLPANTTLDANLKLRGRRI